MLPSLCKIAICHNLTSLITSEDVLQLALPLLLYDIILAFISCWGKKKIFSTDAKYSPCWTEQTFPPMHCSSEWWEGLMIQPRSTLIENAHSPNVVFLWHVKISYQTNMTRYTSNQSGDFQLLRSGRVHALTHFRYFRIEMPWYLGIFIFNTTRINSRLTLLKSQ